MCTPCRHCTELLVLKGHMHHGLLQLGARCFAQQRDQPLLQCVSLAPCQPAQVTLVAFLPCHMPLATNNLHSLDMLSVSLQAGSQPSLFWSASQHKLQQRVPAANLACVSLQAASLLNLQRLLP